MKFANANKLDRKSGGKLPEAHMLTKVVSAHHTF